MSEQVNNNLEKGHVNDDVDQNHQEDPKNKENDCVNSVAIEKLLESTGYQILKVFVGFIKRLFHLFMYIMLIQYLFQYRIPRLC